MIKGPDLRLRRSGRGELIALRPCDIDARTRTVTVQRSIGEVAKRHSLTGERCYLKERLRAGGGEADGVRATVVDVG
jgi:integrase